MSCEAALKSEKKCVKIKHLEYWDRFNMAYLGQKRLSTSAFGEILGAEIAGLVQLEFPYRIDPQAVSVSTALSGTVTSSPPFALVSTLGTGSASFQTRDRGHYQAGQGMACLFTAIFTTGTARTSQYAGLGDAYNGFFFGYNGSTFGILQRQAVYGVTINNIWIPQSTWNQDPFNGKGISGITLDPTEGNVYKIQMQWLGFGNINFFIQNPNNGQFSLVHSIEYGNVNTLTSLSNPSLPASVFVTNVSTNSRSIVQTPCMAIFIEGNLFDGMAIYSHNFQTANINNSRPVFSIRNVSTFNGIRNGKYVLIKYLSVYSLSNQATSYANFQLILNGLSAVTYTSVNSNSVVQFNDGAGFISGGRTLFTFYCANNTFQNIDLAGYNIILNPSDVLTVYANITHVTGNQQAQAVIDWVEGF